VTTALAPGLTTDQVAARVGASYRQLDYWARLGVLSPDVVGAGGSGSRRRWSPVDTAAAQVVTRLARLGAGCEVTRRAADWIYANAWLAEALTDAYLIVELDGTVTPATGSGDWASCGAGAWVVPLATPAL
jgi:hypothetical protein